MNDILVLHIIAVIIAAIGWIGILATVPLFAKLTTIKDIVGYAILMLAYLFLISLITMESERYFLK